MEIHGLGIIQLSLLYSHRDPLIINQPLHSTNFTFSPFSLKFLDLLGKCSKMVKFMVEKVLYIEENIPKSLSSNKQLIGSKNNLNKEDFQEIFLTLLLKPQVEWDGEGKSRNGGLKEEIWMDCFLFDDLQWRGEDFWWRKMKKWWWEASSTSPNAAPLLLSIFLRLSLFWMLYQILKSDTLAVVSRHLHRGIFPLCHSPAASGPAKGKAPFWASLGPSLLRSPLFWFLTTR